MKSFYILSILLFSCSSKENEIEKNIANKEVQFNKDEYFHLFYPKFREAVLTYNDDSLIKFTNFPIELRGNLDDDPVLKLIKNKFIPFFKISINQISAYNPNTDNVCSTFHLFREVNDIKNSENFNFLDSTQRFGNLVFEKIDKVWKLTAFYTDTRELKVE